MRTDQFFICDGCDIVITLCECVDGPTVLREGDPDDGSETDR